jgi:hypothetical protein
VSSLRPPETWRERSVSTLDILMFMREKLSEGVMPEMFLGAATVEAMAAFASGVSLTLYYNHRPDTEYQDFMAWLRDVKGEFPGEGWTRKYLADCRGDHLAAIRKFLDFVAEFVALKRPPA